MATMGTATSPNSISYRASLPAARTFYCAKCTCCEVPALGDLCVFCEDGLICPRQKLKSKDRPVDARQRQVSDLRLQIEREIHELSSALLNQGWKAARAKGVAAKCVADMPEAKFEDRFRRIISGNWGEDLAPVKKIVAKPNGLSLDPEASPGSLGPAIKKAFLPKAAKEVLMEATRTCSVGDCSNRIHANNKSGRCSKHFYVKKTDRASRDSAPDAGKIKRRRDAAPSEANGHAPVAAESTNTNGAAARYRAPMLVTPEFLDRFWASLPLEEKVRILEQIGSEG